MSDEPAEVPGDTATGVFAGHRELLFSVVHSMTGSVSDTEDVLRETWLAWVADAGRQPAGHEVGPNGGRDAEEPRTNLLRIAVGRALESVSMALMAVMETLPPAERAVFVLNEVFGYQHNEIAEILGRHPGAVRQLAHRAREHVRARRPHCPAGPRLQRQVTERFVAALTGDPATLREMLAPDVTMWTDGGGTAGSGLRPVSGRERVARLLSRYAASRPPQRPGVAYRHVDGDRSAVVFPGDSPYAVLVLDLGVPGDQVTGICLVTNPDKSARAEQRPDIHRDR